VQSCPAVTGVGRNAGRLPGNAVPATALGCITRLLWAASSDRLAGVPAIGVDGMALGDRPRAAQGGGCRHPWHRGAGEMSHRDGAGTALQADRPLVLTSDMALLDELLRIAAAAGVDAEVVHDPAAARGLWLDSPLVVVGADAATGVERAALPRRPGLVIATSQVADDALLRTGLALGASAVLSLPLEETTLVAHFTDTAESGGRGGSVVCVVGGRGGAGATTKGGGFA